MRGVLRIAYYEAIRELRKKSLIALLLLAITPIPVALLLRNMISSEVMWALHRFGPILGIRPSRLWAFILGAAEPPPVLSILSMLASASLAGFAWLAAILYGGDLIASDMRDSMIYYILVKPIRRSEYIAGKLLVVTLLMLGLFLLAGIVVYAASWILFGPQEGVGDALIASAVIAVGILPLLLTSSAIGAATRNPLLGSILGFAAYFASSLVTAIAVIASIGGVTLQNLSRLTPALYMGVAVNPYTSYEVLVKAVYAVLTHSGGIVYWVVGPGGFSRELIPLWPITGYAISTLVVSTVILGLVNWLLVARRDL